MRTLGDGELVARARQGSREAAAELFIRHWPGAWKVARTVTGRRDMADDVAQDAFERAFAALGRFDRRRPFGPWLHRIVVNRSLDLLRSERRLIGSEALDRIGSTSYIATLPEAERLRLFDEVRALVADLPRPLRLAYRTDTYVTRRI